MLISYVKLDRTLYLINYGISYEITEVSITSCALLHVVKFLCRYVDPLLYFSLIRLRILRQTLGVINQHTSQG